VSRNELVEAYQQGRISRRTFVRGMMALGLSVTAATTMASRIKAAPAGVSRTGGRYVGNVGDNYDNYGETGGETGGGTTTLPATGAGTTAAQGSLLKTGMIAGAAALVAGGLKRLKGEPKAE
jgi:hypothetical protein